MDLKHFFVVKNGKQEFEDEDLYQTSLKQMEGKRGYVVMKTVKKEVTPGMYSYYFGYIIAECRIRLSEFAGWNYSDIHNRFWNILRPGQDFSRVKASDLINYIDELIPWLFDKYDLTIQPNRKFSKVISG